MKTCICNISALEFYRASGRLLPDVLDLPRTSKLDGCSIPSRITLEDELPHLGIISKPVHVLVGNANAYHQTDYAICHKRLAKLPRNALIQLNPSTFTVGPELLFCELAENDALDDIALARIGYELCGTYVIDESWEGLTNTDAPMTNTAKIERFLERYPKQPGKAKARRALSLMHDGSNSPMETVLCLLFTAPRKIGGLQIPGVHLNYEITTPIGPRYVDVAFPELGVGLEYKGRLYHSIEQSARDDRRQNKIVGSGMMILNVWHEDLCQPHLFNQLVRDFYRTAGIRLRCRGAGFQQLQQLLLHRLTRSI